MLIRKRIRVNRQIRVREVRVINEDGEQLGIMPPQQALEAALQKGLDLVEISPNSTPPVCKIMDYGQYQYQMSKQAQAARKKQRIIHVKEIKFRPKIDGHDFNFKKKNIMKFLNAGDKVKATVIFRGRERAHTELGLKILNRLKDEVAEVGIAESLPALEGPHMVMILSPKKA